MQVRDNVDIADKCHGRFLRPNSQFPFNSHFRFTPRDKAISSRDRLGGVCEMVGVFEEEKMTIGVDDRRCPKVFSLGWLTTVVNGRAPESCLAEPLLERRVGRGEWKGRRVERWVN